MTALLALAIAAALLVAAWTDLAVRRIPNALAGTVAAAALALRLAEGPAALAASLAAATLLFALLALAFCRGLVGGGDVKLATAVALGLPPGAVWGFVVATALAGGALALGYLVAHCLLTAPAVPAGRGAPLVLRVAAAERWRIRRRGPLPYGIAIAIGGLTYFGNHFVMQ